MRQEAVIVLRVGVQRGGAEARLMPHPVEHGFERGEEAAALAPAEPEADDIGDGQAGSSAGTFRAAGWRAAMTAEVISRAG